MRGKPSERKTSVHDYYQINTEIIWNAIGNKLPALKSEIQRMLEAEE